jgi:hypothetical protein
MWLRNGFALWICLTSLFAIDLLARSARANTPENVAGTQSTASDDTLQSQELMKQGAAKYARGDWLGAYEAYQRAWERTPHPAIAANMAATEIKLGQYLQAANHLKYALNLLPLVQIEKRGAVEEQLDQLRERLVAVSLSANLDGVEIWIDDERIGRTPVADEVLLEPGHHSIRAEYAGAAQVKALDLAAGAHIDLAFDLGSAERQSQKLQPASASSPRVSDQPSSVKSHTRTWVLIGGAAATALSLGVAVAMRVQSDHEQADATTLSAQINSVSQNPALATSEGCSGREQAEACDLLARSTHAARRDRNISTGAFLAAGGFGLATVATLLLWRSPTPTSRSGHVGVHALHLGTWLSNRGWGLSANASF